MARKNETNADYVLRDFKVCRGCLSYDKMTELFDMNECNVMPEVFRLVTGTIVAPDDGMPQHLCAFCRKQLVRAVLFQQSCAKAQVFLEDTLRDGTITTDILRKIDKEIYNLQRNYQISPIIVTNNYNDDIDIGNENNVKSNDSNSDEEPLSKKVKKHKRKKKTNDLLEEIKIKSEIDIITNEELDNDYFDNDNGLENMNEIYVKNELENEMKIEVVNTTHDDINVDLIYLTREQQIEELESRKNTDNYINSFYKCDKCYQGFISETSYNKHVMKHDPKRGDYPCTICHAQFTNEVTLRSHVRSFHERRYICRICSHTSKTICKAKEHYKWHNGYTYDCKICGASFSKSTTRLTHIRLRHPSEHSCELCGESFIGKYGLQLHKNKSHTEEELSVTNKCTVCEVKFQNAEALQLHTSLTHQSVCDPGVRPCVHCGENFQNDELLKQHLKANHTSRETYACEECDKTFSRAGAHMSHYRRAHAARAHARPQREYMCDACGLPCTSRATLKCHQRTHTGEKPFHCSHCLKSFTMLQNLRIHIRTHTGERPFQCASCPKAFRHKAALNRHVRVHTGVKPYACPHCDKCFSQSNSMKSHVNTVHLKLPAPYRQHKL